MKMTSWGLLGCLIAYCPGWSVLLAALGWTGDKVESPGLREIYVIQCPKVYDYDKSKYTIPILAPLCWGVLYLQCLESDDGVKLS